MSLPVGFKVSKRIVLPELSGSILCLKSFFPLPFDHIYNSVESHCAITAVTGKGRVRCEKAALDGRVRAPLFQHAVHDLTVGFSHE